MLHTKFRGNPLAGSVIMSSDFYFLVPESFYKKLVQIGNVVSEIFRFEFLYVPDLGLRLRNDIDHQYSHTFIYEPRSEKTGLRGFRPGPTQTGLYSHRKWLEA